MPEFRENPRPSRRAVDTPGHGRGAQWVDKALGRPPTPLREGRSIIPRYRCPLPLEGYATHLVLTDPDDPNRTLWLRSRERRPSPTNTYAWAIVEPDPDPNAAYTYRWVGEKWADPVAATLWAVNDQGYVSTLPERPGGQVWGQ